MIYPKKSLGQNFLIDKNIIYKILNLVNIKNKNVIEVGPGKGALTTEIIKKKPKSIILIEKDKNLANDLSFKYCKYKNVVVLNKDFLKFYFSNLKSKFIILGNIPYNFRHKYF